MDLKPVFMPLSGLLLALALLMQIPALFDGIVHDLEWQAFEISATITLFTGLAFFFVGYKDKTRFELRHGYLFTVACWVFLPLFAALPFVFCGLHLSISDSVFETISGLTTTGATVITGLENLPPGILLWRALLQWMGGIGIVVMAISIFPTLKAGGMQLFQLESSETADKLFPRIREMAFGVFVIYTALTVICGTIYFIEGMGGFDAIVHAMTTVSTGGFSTTDASFAAFKEPSLIWTASFFMFAGSLPFSLMLYTLIKKDHRALFTDPQVQIYTAFVLVVCLGCAIFFNQNHPEFDFAMALTLATFNVISVITTTGYAYGDYTLWGAFAPLFFFFLTFIGGCSGSTAGGIKFFRFHVLWLSLTDQMRRLLHPHRVGLPKIKNKPLTNEISQSVLIYVFLLIVSFVVISLALGFTGLDFMTAISGAATALSNVGPGIGDIIGPVGNFQTLPDAAKWVLSFGMILGRLEYVTLIVILQPAFWRF